MKKNAYIFLFLLYAIIGTGLLVNNIYLRKQLTKNGYVPTFTKYCRESSYDYYIVISTDKETLETYRRKGGELTTTADLDKAFKAATNQLASLYKSASERASQCEEKLNRPLRAFMIREVRK